MTAIAIHKLIKRYGALIALNGVDLEIPRGEFFGLLGPNGAGKTTLIQSIVGLCRPNSGSIHVHGFDVRRQACEAHRLIGFAPQEMNLDRFFSIRKILMYHAGFFGLSRVERKNRADLLLKEFQLTEKSPLQYYRLSGGMQKRLLIAKALISSPQVLILDEPTAGVDVEQRHALWHYLRRLNANGTTIILTTHYIDEAEALCERIGIIHLGEIKELGSPQELINQHCHKQVILKTTKPISKLHLQNLPFKVETEGLILKGIGQDVGKIIEQFYLIVKKEPNCTIVDLHVARGSLEEVFLKVVGESYE